MTLVVHGVIRVAPGDDPASWPDRYGDHWTQHADRPIRHIHFGPDWLAVMARFRDRRCYQLDWGTLAWDASIEEIRRLAGPRYADDPIFVRLEREQQEAFDRLDPSDRHLIYGMEMY